jgi:hypothetical protein
MVAQNCPGCIVKEVDHAHLAKGLIGHRDVGGGVVGTASHVISAGPVSLRCHLRCKLSL